MTDSPVVALGDIADSVDYGITASALQYPDGPKFLRITDIQHGCVNWDTVPWCRSDSRGISEALLRPGDIVFARTGATTGKSFLISDCPVDAVFASYLIRLRVGASTDPSYLSHYFRTPEYWDQISKTARGVAQPGVNATALRALLIPRPPLSKQRRIAEVLDRAEALRAKRRSGIEVLDALTASIFVDLFGDPEANSMGWPRVKLGELIVHGPQNGLYRHSSDYGSGTRILRIDGFYDNIAIPFETLKRVRAGEAESALYALQQNDLVVNRVNSLKFLGKVALIPALDETTLFESNMMRFAVDSDRVIPMYVSKFLQTAFIKAQILSAAKPAVNQASINQQDVRKLIVSVPPLTVQTEFARRVAAVDKLKAAHRASLAHLDALFASLQHRAFRGEL